MDRIVWNIHKGNLERPRQAISGGSWPRSDPLGVAGPVNKADVVFPLKRRPERRIEAEKECTLEEGLLGKEKLCQVSRRRGGSRGMGHVEP